VAYFETTVPLTEAPTWIRSGLNADLNITIASATNTLRLPQRFVDTSGKTPTVQIRQANEVVTKPIEVLFTGNDGFVAIAGLSLGDEVIAP
jgi:hypothetical protein